MSRTLCRVVLSQVDSCKTTATIGSGLLRICNIQKASYSKRSNSEDLAQAFKVVKSKVRYDDDLNSLEGGPNWELLSPRGNRFFFPNMTGPAWLGASTTLNTDEALHTLVDFDSRELSNTNNNNDKLKFDICVCPSLLKENLHELFPAPEVFSSTTMTLIILRFDGDCEKGASKFVLAGREICNRLREQGYWTDFMNPFSGKPFYTWANAKNLYKIDERFRGINMQLSNSASCTIISSAENSDGSFSGTVYTTAPSDYEEFKAILESPLPPDVPDDSNAL